MATLSKRTFIFPFIFSLAQLVPWLLASSQSQPFADTALLNYHGGPLLTGPGTINIYLAWYGGFSQRDRASITDFFASFSPSQDQSVSNWWKLIHSYKDKSGYSISTTVRLVKQVVDIYSLGNRINRTQIANLVKNNIANKKFPLDSNGIYLVVTSKDVTVERFCISSCGFHDSISMFSKTRVVYGHVGDPSVQCPGLCAWPYARQEYGPSGHALVAPNGVGADGMVMNIATILAGAATNPYKTGYFQGDALAPVEVATACAGIFGAGAYPGYPGSLLMDKTSKASYNAFGTNGRKYLLPAIWDQKRSACKVIS